MTNNRDDEGTESTNARLDQNWSAIQRVIDETASFIPPGEWPCTDQATIEIQREHDMYDRGFQLALIAIDPADMGSPREFMIRYTEAFDQVLPPLEAGEWTAIRRAWKAME